MTRDYNISGLTGWVRIDERYVVPLLDSAAFAKAAELAPDSGPSQGYDEYVTLQDGWYLGLSYSGSDVVQAALDASDLDVLCAGSPNPFSINALFDHAARIEGLVPQFDSSSRSGAAFRSPALINNPVLMPHGDAELPKTHRF